MRRVRLATAIALILATGAWLLPSPGRACSSDHPTFAEAVRGAGAIARVTVIEGFDTYFDDPTRSETYRIERLLKGALPQVVTVAPAWTSLCHDSIGSYVGTESEGKTIVIAFEMSYYGDTIHPMWMIDGYQRLSGSAGLPDGVNTLAGLEAAILEELDLPDTSSVTANRKSSLPFLLIPVAALWYLVSLAWFRRLPR